jgi:hypothetical protein
MAEVIEQQGRQAQADRAPRNGGSVTIEFDGENRNFMLSAFGDGTTVRGAFSISRCINAPGEMRGMPDIPGLYLTLSFRDNKLTIEDPLRKDRDLCAKIKSSLRAANRFKSDGELTGVATVEKTLNVHQMKTLVLEIRDRINANEVRIIKGEFPTDDQIEKLPGKKLLDPGRNFPTSQPMFEEDWWDWASRARVVQLSGDPRVQ